MLSVVVLLEQCAVNDVSLLCTVYITDRSLHPYCAPSHQAFLDWKVGKRRAAEVCSIVNFRQRLCCHGLVW